MAEVKKVKKTPLTIVKQNKGNNETYIHYISFNSFKRALEAKKKIKLHVKKATLERFILNGTKTYGIYVIKND